MAQFSNLSEENAELIQKIQKNLVYIIMFVLRVLEKLRTNNLLRYNWIIQ